ncbi:MAG: molybdopterin-dependent oxidoreductase [Solirubrobacterales bacterium]
MPDPQSAPSRVDFELNGRPVVTEAGQATSLLRALRDRFGLTGAKPICEQGACGGCTVLVDGVPARSCLLPVARAAGTSVTTVEGLGDDGSLTALQREFAERGALQCGYCTSGMLTRLTALLADEPELDEPRIREALGSNLCRCTCYEKIVEATLAAAGSLDGSKEDEPLAVGARVPQQRAWTLVNGEQRFASDIELQGMLHGRILRSPHPHAAIRSIDTSAARAIEGVVDVITAEDVPEERYNSAFRNPNDALTLRPDERVLNEKSRYDGDRVAAVAAESAEAAAAAIAAIDVDYEPLSAYTDPLAALEAGTDEIHAGTGNEAAESKSIEYGDPEAGWAEAEVELEGTFRSQSVQHANLEPKTVIAEPTADGRMTMYATTQVPFHVRTNYPKALGESESDLRVIAVGMGGGQGERSDPADEFVAALLARRTSRPVKITNSREEQFSSTRVRHAAIVESRLGARRDGTLVARGTRSVIGTGGYATMGYRVSLSLGIRSAALYRVPNVSYEGRVAYTNTPVGGGMRGFGSPQAAFPIESQLDELAEQLEVDPIDLRIQNLVRVGDPYLDLGAGWEVRSAAAVEGLELLRERSGWDAKRAELGGAGANGALRGIGVAVGSHISTVMPYYRDHGHAQIELGEDGAFIVRIGVPETGTGSTTIYAQMAAEELGVEPGRVRVETADTDSTPYDQGAHSSRTTYVAGGAVQGAAAEIKDEIRREASEMLEARVEDVEYEAGAVRVAGAPETAVPVADVAHWLRYESDHPRRLGAEGSNVPTNVAPPYAMCVAEVEIAPDTGKLSVESVMLAIDFGVAVNPMFVEGQLDGAIHMGVGAAISEDMRFDEDGRLLTRSFNEYQLLRAAEMPRIETIILDSDEPTGPFGAKGLGEASVVPIAPAIANAAAHATGARPRELPLTPERVLGLLEP